MKRKLFCYSSFSGRLCFFRIWICFPSIFCIMVLDCSSSNLLLFDEFFHSFLFFFFIELLLIPLYYCVYIGFDKYWYSIPSVSFMKRHYSSRECTFLSTFIHIPRHKNGDLKKKCRTRLIASSTSHRSTFQRFCCTSIYKGSGDCIQDAKACPEFLRHKTSLLNPGTLCFS